MPQSEQKQEYDRLRREAERLAGGLTDLSQRATVYHHIFRESGGNHVFPLIAAHGALWARGWFQFGHRLGQILSWQFAGRRQMQREHLSRLQDFADTIRDINRLVCIDTYVNFHWTRRYGTAPHAANLIAPELLDALNRVHAANDAGIPLPDASRRDVFAAHFLHEQTHIVGPRIEAAVANLNWPALQFLALKPVVRFACFPRGRRLWFRDFSRRSERVANGLKAFDWAAASGWEHAEASLREYNILPAEFFAGSERYFANLRQSLLGMPA